MKGAYNDYSTGRHAHPFDFLEWPTVLDCQADADVRQTSRGHGKL
ncbi:hypothetical protein ABZ438_20600 [Streptomyces sp. NPDC005786]